MIGLYTRNPLRNSSTAVFRSQNLCRSTRSTFYGEAISKCLSDVSYFLAVRCSLLPLFFAPLSFVFNSLQPLLAKIRGVGGGRPPTVWFQEIPSHLNHQLNRRFGVTSIIAASPSSKPAFDLYTLNFLYNRFRISRKSGPFRMIFAGPRTITPPMLCQFALYTSATRSEVHTS